jgi:aminoglycoside 3'-phosphotransferase-1
MSILIESLPPDWRADLHRARVKPVDTGMSGAAVFRIGPRRHAERYLKIADGDAAEQLRREVTRTRWLATQGVYVPHILRVHDAAGVIAVEMHALPGLNGEDVSLPAPALIARIAQALATLHALPASECPFDESIAARLARARQAIDAGEVDPSQFETRNRRATPEALYQRLAASVPREDFVVAHGDATLSNVIVADDDTIGFVDCGQAGRADRYLDLAIMGQGVKEKFGKSAVAAFARAYGEPSWQSAKARYFEDLYELF